jgi:hypothetical protein
MNTPNGYSMPLIKNASEELIADWERRAAPRYKIELHSSVLITAFGSSADDKESCLVLQGQMLDVSISGLGLIVSNADIKELIKLGKDSVMRLLLPLPKKAIELEAVPVRYQQLDKKDADKVLIGALIRDMNGSDRILFMQFIREGEALQRKI